MVKYFFKINNRMKNVVVFAVFTLILFSSCRKSDRAEDNKTVSTFESATAINLFNDAFKQVHEAIVSDTFLGAKTSPAVLLNCVDSIRKYPELGPYPIQLVISYKPEGIVCSDERIRSGEIVATLFNNYFDSNMVLRIDFKEYKVSDLQIEGKIEIVRQNFGWGELPKYSFNVENGKIYNLEKGFEKNVNIAYSGQFDMQWGKGYSSTDSPKNDEFRYTGTFEGRDSRGAFFTAEITKNVVFDFKCIYEYEGNYTLKNENVVDRFVELGRATCSPDVFVKFYNTTETVKRKY